jgi:serine kinase of HPr protein (carbohydrate metabolism regulator)
VKRCFSAYGVRLRFELEAAHARALRACLPPLTRVSTWRRGGLDWRVEIGARRCRAWLADELITDAPSPAQFWPQLESDVHLRVAAASRKYVFVHAGVVALRGRAIVIPGRSFAGKSTTTVALLRAGATYYSDEYAVIDARGLVRPFARLLSVRGEGATAGEKIPARSFGAKTGKRAIPIGLVLATRYKKSARWHPRQLTNGEAVLALLDNTVAAREAPALALKSIGRALKSATAYASDRGDVDQLLTFLREQDWL